MVNLDVNSLYTNNPMNKCNLLGKQFNKLRINLSLRIDTIIICN